ncbi:nucleotidyl transferase AbiEii/AbiGii toxin family protein [Actimicrobium sp. CCI2.3]|uniref:nucleotidyl transferase AbiEii/AbiGii toxin family protein n=1 Tax=Actimicrobium sp. CCI2.3 TaxID=3048616 RepID=UPI002AB463FD|nr:nucleotidyl transferase AbiEii/AbiGii toxin family protein [Actimicrobium sp. CCI2.3]MDY7576134.1 nucleotidyl transferase AbiEii/AbiGii toxin family protein [Actimicrobium sp. CCI2.3]MEB0023464.1 nucleotidyl transferase AbiEii/AbiGii toxin family protein [Actimicrobium sp. CCI2.3]
MGRFKPWMAILPEAQRQLWSELQPTQALGFVLYGGTAIALRLGHRQSVDFDFFTEKPLDKKAIFFAFDFLQQAITLQDEPNAFTVLVPAGELSDQQVKISFFGTIGFGRVAAPDLTEDGILEVASMDDLMATKVKVILQRVEAKDYRDIAAMINGGVSLSKGLAAAKAMFGQSFQPSESLKAMVYFQGGDLDQLTSDEKKTLINAASNVRDLPDVTITSRQLSLSTKAGLP